MCDRFADSTLAYQGAGRGLDVDELAAVISFATAGRRPDMTILLDLPVEVGLGRKSTRDESQEGWNRFEAEALAFHQRVREAYHELVQAEPERWRCVDASQPPETVSEEVWRLVVPRLGLVTR